jgi:hypothetical protein
LRTKLGHKTQDDGVFFISYQDYLSYYRSTTICKLHEGYTTKTLKVKPNTQKSYQVISAKLRDRSKVYFSVIQRSQRFVQQNKASVPVTSFVKMFLAKDINYDTLQPLEYLASKCLNSDCVTLDLPYPLPVGEYVVLVEVDWSSTVGDKDRKYVLQAYTHSATLDLSLAPQTPHFDYLAETLKSLAKLKTIRKTY